CNRFIAIGLTLNTLKNRKDVQKILKEKHVKLPEAESLSKYINYTRENKLGLGNPSLEEYLNQNHLDLSLYKLLGWSEAVNRTFPHISAKIPPFDHIKECLHLMSQHADILIVSKTPYVDLANYWESQKIDQYVQMIAGQEMGSKGHHIEIAKNAGKYEDNQVMMIGDGGGDLKAVKENKGLFYPTPPGQEQEAWENFPGAFQKFVKGEYQGKYEETLLNIFKKALLASPPWLQAGYNHIEAYKEKQNLRKDLYKKFNPRGRLIIL
ncbi:MAG: HAD hydrolase-like protein, partial [Candidatus Atribacteria bacterium]|nr:HAD hydrolase-like protein [Candidatus Atribacteria bacterium]